MKKINLIGGPYNGRRINDLGMVRIRMGIASEWQGQLPAVGARSGFAVYEPSEDRESAFFEGNVWEGATVKIIRQ